MLEKQMVMDRQKSNTAKLELALFVHVLYSKFKVVE